MKIRKDKSVKLDGNEIRINNFCFKLEPEYIKIADVSGVFSHRVNRRLPLGSWLAAQEALQRAGGMPAEPIPPC